MTTSSAIIVGGGLAGMVVARELALHGWRVTLIERTSRLGGKAGFDLKNGETKSLPIVQVPPEWPRALLVIARILMIPLVAVARVLAWFEDKFSPHRPYASEVRRQATPGLQMGSRSPREP